MRKRGIYAMYKGDKFLCQGTFEEICEKMNIKETTFRYYRTKHWLINRHENRNNCRIIIRIDDEDKFYDNLPI